VRTISEICFPSCFSATVYWPQEINIVLGITPRLFRFLRMPSTKLRSSLL
jgi:hypothetical protein